MNVPTLPRIKVCGLTRAEDAVLAATLGAWALGFIFYEASPRAITPKAAGKIASLAPGLKRVGVFVDADLDTILGAVERSGIDTVQLHGDESPRFCQELKSRLGPLSVIKALRPREREDLERLEDYGTSCEAILLDSFVDGANGGTGVTGDWSLAAEAAQRRKIILAGGLRPENIRAAIRIPGLYAVDVSSGLEEAPGRKSKEKMKKFFENAMKQELPT